MKNLYEVTYSDKFLSYIYSGDLEPPINEYDIAVITTTKRRAEEVATEMNNIEDLIEEAKDLGTDIDVQAKVKKIKISNIKLKALISKILKTGSNNPYGKDLMLKSSYSGYVGYVVLDLTYKEKER